MAASVMVGIGETYLPAFVLALSGSQLACGLVTTLPLVVGAVLQLASPWGVGRCRSYRRWVVFCVAAQAATFVPLAMAAARGTLPLLMVFAIVSLYWATGMASGPPWNVWMETLVPQRVRTRYFAWRTRVGQWGIVAGFLLGGVGLHMATRDGRYLGIFAVLFLVAAASRLTSASLLACQREPLHPADLRPLPPARRMIRFLTDGADGRLLLYLLAAQGAVQIAAPYFTPYMLGHLKFSYSTYVVLVCTANVAKILFLPALGRFIQRRGAYRVFWLSALGIVVLPGMWLVSSDFRYLICIQVFSGVLWGANDLASLMLFFETITHEKRISILTVFNLANAMATAVGSLLGGALLLIAGASGTTYLLLFVLSTVARAAALVLLVRVPAAARFRQASTLRPTASLRPKTVPTLARPQYLQGPHWSRGITPAAGVLPAAES